MTFTEPIEGETARLVAHAVNRTPEARPIVLAPAA
jgi:hypothetical protein